MSRKRIIIALLVLVVVGSGVGFVTVVLPAWRGQASPLLIEAQNLPVTTESGVQGHRELRFHNQTNKSLSIRLQRTDCECAHIQVCVTPDEWKGLNSPAFLEHAADPTLTWQPLEQGGQSFVIPPRSQGMIRVVFKAFKVGTSSIGIDLRVDDGEKETAQHFESPVSFIPPAFFCSEDNLNVMEISVGRLHAGEERTARFLCCSTTRDKFTLTPAPPGSDPCLVYGIPEPLTSEELHALSLKPGGAEVRAGFRVKVTVREQADDQRLDIGPFRRRIVYKTDIYTDHQVETYVSGWVEGEIALAGSECKDHLDFGTIIPDDPKPVTFTLESRDPRLQLSVDEERTLPFFKLELLDGKEGKTSERGKRWQVRVVFRKDALFRGEFPNPTRPGYETADACCLVFLLLHPGQESSKERRLLVPVRGNVRLY